MNDGLLLSEDFARETAEMLRWWRRNRHQFVQTQAMAYREGPEDFDPWYYLYNDDSTAILQYAPCAIFGPNMNPGDSGYTPTDITGWNRTLYGTNYKTFVSFEHYFFRSWGVALEEIAPGAVGKVAIYGTVPCRMKGTPQDDSLGVSTAVVPVPDQSWVRPSLNGTAHLHNGHFTDADADGLRYCWITLGKDAGFIGHVMYASGDNTEITDSTTRYYGCDSAYTKNRNCLTKYYQHTSGSISWNGKTTLINNADGVEGIEEGTVLAESTVVIYPYTAGTPSAADGLHTIYGEFIVIDEDGDYVTSSGYSIGKWYQYFDSIPTSPTYSLRHQPQHCQTLHFRTRYKLEAGSKMLPVLYRTAGSNLTFKVDSWNTTFTEYPEGLLH